MSAGKDEEYCQTYLNKLDDDEGDDDNQVENVEIDFTIVSDSDKDVDNKGAIIIDEEGNYYYQSSEKVVKIERLKKASEIPVKKVAPAVLFSTCNSKSSAQTKSVTLKKAEVKANTSSKIKQEGNGTTKTAAGKITSEISSQEVHEFDSNTLAQIETVTPKKTKGKSITITKIKQEANGTITSEMSSQEVYEFDENVQDSHDPGDITDPDYIAKGIIKKEIKPIGNELATHACTICSYHTNKKFLLTRHLKTHLGERPYKCSVCERGFKSNATLLNHRNVHLGYKPHACPSCEMAFTTSGELVRHERYRHSHIKPYMCTECDYCCVEMSKLRRHMRCHTGERPYQCPHCTYASPDTFKLKRHIRVHTGEKPYECDICHARFTQSNSLKNHRLIHSVNEKPVFQCHLCPSTCGRKVDLRLHIKKLHSSDQPIPCKRCGKELPDRYSYKMHIKTHDGEKFYRCEYCPYASISKRHLETHALIHFDAKPFVCEICQNTFRQKPLLTRHMKIYHLANYEPPPPRKKNHKCPHCNKMFARNGNLIRHMEIHDPTSRLLKEREELKIGRMKRVKPDGTVVTVTNSDSSSKLFDENEETLYEETQEQHQIDEEELQKEYVESEEYNEDDIQYVYESETGEYEEDYQEEQYEEEQYKQELDESNENSNLLDVKQEKVEAMDVAQTALTNTLNAKDNDNKDSQIVSLDVNGDDYMVIEFMPDDDDDEKQQQENEEQLQTTKYNQKPTTFEENSNKKSQRLISDYFGFEVNADEEDEDNEETIQLLEIIDED